MYGVCDCGKWGDAPKDFKENKHFLKCSSCGALMYLIRSHPSEAGYREKDKVEVTNVKQ